ncbi:putative ATP-dependent RNA helicase [Myriangium duriaei CBS 260.36]|uniref:ATP-dependent rRNA helicase RRP3 n=1 Tax=Myriangium duriaei CBS 260.36 TaxID=1168546 RepID=A0A9P4J7G5_9PEZI|nr:putative ATP-dependent RNA helicase [Myriangium duriaei CBS 260.36]
MSAIKKRKLAPEKAARGTEAPIKRKKRSQEERQPSPSSSEEELEAVVAEESDDESEAGESAAEKEEPQVEQPAPVARTFADLGIIDSLCDACTALGYKAPTPIQAESIPPALEGRDLIGLAETGSGKTAAFALPILQALMDKPQSLFGLILAPTRELAHQISDQFEALGSLIAVKCAVLVGGSDMVSQAIALAKRPHIIVATPGRLLDHLQNTKGFSLRTLKYLVMDEADRLLDLDFGPILDKILRVLPRERRTYLFSATISSKVESLQRASLSNPLKVSISTSSHQTVKTLLQSYMFIPHKHKDIYLVALLSDHIGHSTILFTRTIHETQRLAFLLRALGFGAIPLHGQMSQSSRLGALNKFKAHSRDILVATDVAARGLDIPSVDLVVNYDLPSDSKTYVHRVGRTARAGKSGVAVSLVTQYDVEVYLRTEKALGRKLDEMKLVKEEVMAYTDKVSEAQRVAIRELKDAEEKKRGKGGRRDFRKGKGGGRDAMDADEG